MSLPGELRVPDELDAQCDGPACRGGFAGRLDIAALLEEQLILPEGVDCLDGDPAVLVSALVRGANGAVSAREQCRCPVRFNRATSKTKYTGQALVEWGPHPSLNPIVRLRGTCHTHSK